VNQLALFSDTMPAAPPVPPPADTRRQARERILPIAGKQARRVLEFLRSREKRGGTDHEIAAALEMLPDSARARRTELRDLGVILDSGERRPTPSGRWAKVWVVADISGEIIPAAPPDRDESPNQTSEADDAPF